MQVNKIEKLKKQIQYLIQFFSLLCKHLPINRLNKSVTLFSLLIQRISKSQVN